MDKVPKMPISPKILMTGATGYLGSAFLNVLPEDLAGKLTCLYHSQILPSHSHLNWLPHEKISDENVFGGVDLVLILGCPRSAPSDVLANHISETIQLAKTAVNSGVKKIVYASSQAVYGAQPTFWVENSVLAPVTPHGWAKLACESVLETISQHTDVKTTSLRFPKLIGPGARFRLNSGEVPHQIAAAALAGKPVSISNHFLTKKFDFWDVRDAASTLKTMLLNDLETLPNKLNFSVKLIASGSEIIEKVNQHCVARGREKLKLRVSQDTRKERDFGMDDALMRNIISDIYQRPFEATIQDIIDYVEKT